jgi:hypothetical protein
MKAALVIKFFIILPLIIFLDYLIMAVIGCTSCLFGLNNNFYCGPFCLAGKILLGLSAMGFLIILGPEIKSVSTIVLTWLKLK